MSAIIDVDGTKATFIDALGEWHSTPGLAAALNVLTLDREIGGFPTSDPNHAATAARNAQKFFDATILHIDPTPPVLPNVSY